VILAPKISPKLLLGNLPRTNLRFIPRVFKPFLPYLSSFTSSFSKASALGRRLPRPTRKLLVLVVFLLTVFCVSDLLGRQQTVPLSLGGGGSSRQIWMEEDAAGSITVEDKDWNEGHPIR